MVGYRPVCRGPEVVDPDDRAVVQISGVIHQFVVEWMPGGVGDENQVPALLQRGFNGNQRLLIDHLRIGADALRGGHRRSGDQADANRMREDAAGCSAAAFPL